MPPLHAHFLFQVIMDAVEFADPYHLPFFAAHAAVDPASLTPDSPASQPFPIFEVEVTPSHGTKLHASPHLQHRERGMAYKQEPDEHHIFGASGFDVWTYRVYEFDADRGQRGPFLGYHVIVAVPDFAEPTWRLAC